MQDPILAQLYVGEPDKPKPQQKKTTDPLESLKVQRAPRGKAAAGAFAGATASASAGAAGGKAKPQTAPPENEFTQNVRRILEGKGMLPPQQAAPSGPSQDELARRPDAEFHVPGYVIANMRKREAAARVPKHLQDPKNWPESYKQALLDPDSEEARAHQYDENTYGMPTFGYVKDPDRDYRLKEARLAKQPGNIFSEARAMDARLRELGFDVSPEDRHTLIGQLWLRNGMEKDDDPVKEGTGKMVADLYANTGPEELQRLVEMGRARRAVKDMRAGRKPEDRDVEDLRNLTGGQIQPEEAFRLMSKRGDDGVVNLSSGATVGADPAEDARRWREGQGHPLRMSKETALEAFGEGLGVGEYEEAMGLKPDQTLMDLARGASFVSDGPKRDLSTMLAESGTDPRSMVGTIVRDEPGIGQADDWGLYARSFAALLPSKWATTARQATGRSYEETSLTGQIAEQGANAIGALAEAVALGGTGQTILKGSAAMAGQASKLAKMGDFALNYIAQTIPSTAVLFDQNDGDVGKTVDQVVEGLARMVDPTVYGNPNVPVPEKVAAAINQAFLALGVTYTGLSRVAKVKTAFPQDLTPAFIEREWSRMPDALRAEAGRIAAEVHEGLLAGNKQTVDSADPVLSDTFLGQGKSSATLLARAAALIEAKGGQSALDTLRNIRYTYDGELTGFTPEVKALVEEDVVSQTPPAPTGPEPLPEGRGVRLGQDYFFKRDRSRQDFTYEVWPLEKLVPSHDPFTFENNPNYSIKEIQDRDRARAASKEQVDALARGFNVEYALAHHLNANEGAPSVRSDGTVVIGNGRTMGMFRMAKGQGDLKAWGDYQKQVRAMAGIPDTDLGDYVLVRRLPDTMTDADVIALGEDSNRDVGLAKSAPESAATDAGKLPDDFWQVLRPVGDTLQDALESPQNKGLVDRFINQFGPDIRGELVDEDGAVSAAGIQRIEDAAVLHLLGDGGKRFFKAFREKGDESSRLVNGLFKAMPELLKARSPELTNVLNTLLDEMMRFRVFKKSKKGNWATYRDQINVDQLPEEFHDVFKALGDQVSKGGADGVADVFTGLIKSGRLKEIADRLAGQEPLLSKERKDAYIVARNLQPSFAKAIAARGAIDLGDGYFAVKNDPMGRAEIEQSGMMVDAARTKDYNRRYANQAGMFGEEMAVKEPEPPEPVQETLFSKGSDVRDGEGFDTRGAFVFDEESGTALVKLGDKATVAEVAHETAHYLRRLLPENILREVQESLGLNEWDTAAEERFARAFELYLTEKASTPGLDPVMAKVAQAVKDVYDKRGGVAYQAEPHIGEGALTVPESLRGIFDEMASSPEAWPGMAAPRPEEDYADLEPGDVETASGRDSGARTEGVGEVLPRVSELADNADAGGATTKPDDPFADIPAPESTRPEAAARPVPEESVRAKAAAVGVGGADVQAIVDGVFGTPEQQAALLARPDLVQKLKEAYGLPETADDKITVEGAATVERQAQNQFDTEAANRRMPKPKRATRGKAALKSEERRIPGLKEEDLDALLDDMFEGEAPAEAKSLIGSVKEGLRHFEQTVAGTVTDIVSELSLHGEPGKEAASKITDAFVGGRRLSREHRQRIYNTVGATWKLGRLTPPWVRRRAMAEVRDTFNAVLRRWDGEERDKVLLMDPGALDEWAKLSGGAKPIEDGSVPPTLQQIKLFAEWARVNSDLASAAWKEGVGPMRTVDADTPKYEKKLRGKTVRILLEGGKRDAPGVLEEGVWVGWDDERHQALVLTKNGTRRLGVGDFFIHQSMVDGVDFMPLKLKEGMAEKLGKEGSPERATAIKTIMLGKDPQPGTKRVLTQAEATKILDSHLNGVEVTVPGNRLTRIERPRLPLRFPDEFYEWDSKELMDFHIDATGKRIAQAQAFGRDMSLLAADLAEAAGTNAAQLKRWKDSLDAAMGYGRLNTHGEKIAQKAAGAFGTAMVLTALTSGKTALRQFGSVATTEAAHWPTSTLHPQAILDTFSPNWWKAVHESGLLDEDWGIYHGTDMLGAAKEVGTKALKVSGVVQADLVVRVNAASTAVRGAKLAVGKLAKLSDENIPQSVFYRYLRDVFRMSDDQVMNMVDRARANGGKFRFDDSTRFLWDKALAGGIIPQGVTDPVMFPRVINEHPVFRGLFTLNTFNYFQTKNVGRALNEMRQGNPAPLLKLAVAGTIVGNAVMAGIQGLEKKKQTFVWFHWFKLNKGMGDKEAFSAAVDAAAARAENPSFHWVTDMDWSDLADDGTRDTILNAVADGTSASGVLGFYQEMADVFKMASGPYNTQAYDRQQAALAGLSPTLLSVATKMAAQTYEAYQDQKRYRDKELMGEVKPDDEKPDYLADVAGGIVHSIGVPGLGYGQYRKPAGWKVAMEELSDDAGKLARRFNSYPNLKKRKGEDDQSFLVRVRNDAKDWDARLRALKGLKGTELRAEVLRATKEAFRARRGTSPD